MDPVFLAPTERSLWGHPHRSIEGPGESGLGEVIDLHRLFCPSQEANPGKGRRPAGSQGVGAGRTPLPKQHGGQPRPPDHPVVTRAPLPRPTGCISGGLQLTP